MEKGLKYQTVLLKLSGESLLGDRAYGVSPDQARAIASEIREVTLLGVKLGIVIGAGNIFRGLPASQKGMDRVAADYIGMLATLINCLTLQEVMQRLGVEARVISALSVPAVAEPYHDRSVRDHLDKGRVLLFAAGTGHPYFTTDTAAVLRALQIGADIILKATKVDGVYDRDPMIHPEAVRFDRITFTESLARNLKIMDATALSLCRDNGLPIGVFNFFSPGSVMKVITGESIGTIIEE
jgi:uridylate kinase